MTDQESLRCAYLLDGNGGGKALGWNEVCQWTPEQGVLWVHLDYTFEKTEQWLNNGSGLDKIVANALLAAESRPRTEIFAGGVLVFLRGVNLNPGQQPEDMVSIRLWLDNHRIITSCKRQLLSIEDIRQLINNGIGPKSSSDFFCMLNDRLTDRMADVIENIDEQVDDLEAEVIKAQSHILRSQLSDIRRQAILIRRYLSPQREALNRFYSEPIAVISAKDKIRIREIVDRLVRYIEDLDAARDRAVVTHEELMSLISEQLDRRMYLLSLIAVIFLPLTFVTGLLGINVGGIPGSNNHWAFTIVASILVSIVLVMLWVFRRKQWM